MTIIKDTVGAKKSKINLLTKTQLLAADSLSEKEQYFVDPQFTGGKLLATDSSGDIVESNDTPSTIQALSATDSITLADNVFYKGGTQTALTIALPSSADVDFVCQITFKSGSTATTFTEPLTGLVWDDRSVDLLDGVFVPEINKNYTAIIYYNGFQFVGITGGENAS